MIAGAIPQRPPPHSDPGCSPNILARLLTGRDYLSYSAISTYQRCPLRYYFGYVSGVVPEYKASSLLFGGAIHAALELHFRRRFEALDAPDIDELMAMFAQSWKAEATLPVKYGRGESPDTLRDLARNMLVAFQASEVSQLDTRLLAVEEEFRAPLIPGAPDLLGRVDLLTATPETLQIIDFKTSRSKWSLAKVEEALPQMLLYRELLRPVARALGLRTVQVRWIVLTKAKAPVVEVHQRIPTQHEVARIKGIVGQVWQAIAGQHFYPTPSFSTCRCCHYRTACAQWSG